MLAHVLWLLLLVTDRWFTLHLSLSLQWPACWVDIPDRSASSSSKVVQDIGDVYNEELGAVSPSLILALRAAFESNCAGVLGVLLLRPGFCRLIASFSLSRRRSDPEAPSRR